MRLGAQPCQLVVGTKSARLYEAFVVNERHRHRYEFNNAYRERFENAGYVFSGFTPDGKLVEIIELPKHPFFIASQFHPEFHSKPHQPHPFTIRYSGPSNAVAASYQGVVFVASTGAALPVTPYAFVNLKVGGAPAAAPQFIVDGSPADYVAFPGLSGDDGSRTALQIGVRNNGSSPMDVAFEIGPEVWLTTDATWNATRFLLESSTFS